MGAEDYIFSIIDHFNCVASRVTLNLETMSSVQKLEIAYSATSMFVDDTK